MEITKVVSGKKVKKKVKGNKKTLKEKLIEKNKIINKLSVKPADRNQNIPPNWFVYEDLGEQEYNKRLSILNKENLTIEQLKSRLVQAEMVIAYEHYLSSNMLLPTHIEGRKAINDAIEHIKETEQIRKEGVNKTKRNQDKKNLIKKIMKNLKDEKSEISVDDWRVFNLRATTAGLSESYARNYWKEITGFESTKKIHTT
jgi:hypothetical protein